jgi:hypothetical protein
MTDFTIPYPPHEAAHIVKAAFERMPSVSTYEVERDGEVIVGITDGGLTSFGEEIVVSFPEAHPDDGDADPATVISVMAQPRRAHNLNANPWKHKADFIEELESLKGTPAADLELAENLESTSTDDVDVAEAEVFRLGFKVMILVVLGLSIVMALIAAVAWWL